jgi:hypothetical protein
MEFANQANDRQSIGQRILDQDFAGLFYAIHKTKRFIEPVAKMPSAAVRPYLPVGVRPKHRDAQRIAPFLATGSIQNYLCLIPDYCSD